MFSLLSNIPFGVQTHLLAKKDASRVHQHQLLPANKCEPFVDKNFSRSPFTPHYILEILHSVHMTHLPRQLKTLPK